ncbi:hypothetical protein yc1106_00760 [Curvularia clavata]|uniref:Purine permease n=1 Tax=Curvularia clavata TaxID=95742 RepID=A0A9Q8Z0B5_CURCL|nr:hypothetical protein yc1106_00760 [Curvularia clavata]
MSAMMHLTAALGSDPIIDPEEATYKLAKQWQGDIIDSPAGPCSSNHAEAFVVFSQDIPSQSLGFFDSKAATLEFNVAGHDLVIHHSKGLLTSDRKAGTTGAAIWKVTPLFANWISSPTNFLITSSLLRPDSTVLELGAGVSGIVALSLGPRVGRYIATDQAYVLKLLRQNIAENLGTVFSQPRKGKNSKGGSKGGGNADNAMSVEDRITTMELDWETDSVSHLPPVDLIVSCDCVYNEALIEPLNSTCAAICRLREDEKKPTLCLIAQQLRSPDVFETWLKSFHDKFWCLCREGLIGTYDYAFLFRPNLPFMRRERRAAPFFGLNDRVPVLLALLLGFQHSLAMLAGVITPPIILSNAANLSGDQQRYLVSTSLIICGILSSVQITRFHIWRTPYYIATGALSQMYATGYCPTAADGTKLPCPNGYGAILGTCALCALLEIGMSFTSPRILKKVFPPLVTGPTVLLIGVKLVTTGFQNWAGGSGDCKSRPESGLFQLCPNINAPHALPWGSAEFIGLGFSVFITIIICERFGAPIMKSTAVVIGLLVGCIIAGATGYFDRSSIDSAPVVSFIWVETFKLTVYPPIILPLLAVYMVCAMEAIGDITATCDVSRVEVDGPLFDSRIQGGVLADGIAGMIAALCTITPMSTFAQNCGVVALTRCANRKAGYACCFWLIIMGIFAKFAAALVAIPSAVLGGMTTFLFSAVTVSGIRIISTMPFTRRNRFILTAGFTLGFGATMVPTWFSYVFTYSGPNTALRGFYNAIELVLETGFAVVALVTVVLNLVLPEEIEDEETPELVADEMDKAQEEEKWDQGRKGAAGDVEGRASSDIVASKAA